MAGFKDLETVELVDYQQICDSALAGCFPSGAQIEPEELRSISSSLIEHGELLLSGQGALRVGHNEIKAFNTAAQLLAEAKKFPRPVCVMDFRSDVGLNPISLLSRQRQIRTQLLELRVQQADKHQPPPIVLIFGYDKATLDTLDPQWSIDNLLNAYTQGDQGWSVIFSGSGRLNPSKLSTTLTGHALTTGLALKEDRPR